MPDVGKRRPSRGVGLPSTVTKLLMQVIGVIGRIGHDDLGGQSLDQCGRLRCIALLTCAKREAYRTSQAANGQMYLGAQATARAAERLILRPLFLPRRRADAPGRWWNR